MIGSFIADRRLQLGLSRHDVSLATGLSLDAIRRIEDTGQPPGITLEAATRLALALAIDLNRLLSPDPTWSAADATRLEALLANADQPLTLTGIARALQWKLARAHRAIVVLNKRLEPTGQALRHTINAGYTLAARGHILRPAELARLRRHQQPLSTTDAVLLRDLIDRNANNRHYDDFNAEQKTGLARLAASDLVGTDGIWVGLSANAEFDLQPELRRDAPYRA